MEKLTIDQALQRGIVAHKAGELQEAHRLYMSIIKIQPKHPDANHNMGVLVASLGKVEQALPFFKTALEANSTTAQFWLSYIDALVKLEQWAYAKAIFDKAKNHGIKFDGFDWIEERLKHQAGAAVSKDCIGQDPPQNEVQSLINLYNLGQVQLLLERVTSLLQQFSNSSVLHNLLGGVYYSLGQLEAAVAAYNRALIVRPNNAEAYNNLGTALQDLGKLHDAVDAYNKALIIKPAFPEAGSNMGTALRTLSFEKPDPGLQRTITSLIDKKYVRPKDVAFAAISLLKFESALSLQLETLDVSSLKHQLPAIVSNLASLSLLLKLMSACPIPDISLENLLQFLRARLLLSVEEITFSADILQFQSALALQCFTNEYIYALSDPEEKALAILETTVEEVLSNGDQPSPQSVLCLASYTPLYQYEWATLLMVTEVIEDVFIRQVLEPNRENDLKMSLSRLDEITDEVSSKVREQYEANPYPRWVYLGLHPKPTSINTMVNTQKLKLFNDRIKEVGSPNILIAGCGTGQHSIWTASRFKDSKVLAIDLSLSSLAYAKRKAEDLDIQNIELMQADILHLGALEKQFDIVESVGVLHHLYDPLAGWRALTDRLKPGGLMRIGLYSELARQDVGRIRRRIIEEGIDSSNEAMKSFRSEAITSDQEHYQQLMNSHDFYSVSTFRDLLFHVQEHKFTIPQIRKCLDELGLEFCGFDTASVISDFKLSNTGEFDPYNLMSWHAYEEANPSAFSGMYQFWCQKIG